MKRFQFRMTRRRKMELIVFFGIGITLFLINKVLFMIFLIGFVAFLMMYSINDIESHKQATKKEKQKNYMDR